MQQLRVYLGFPVGLERVLEEKENLLVPARGGTVEEPASTFVGNNTRGENSAFISASPCRCPSEIREVVEVAVNVRSQNHGKLHS